ncbi:energy transducer TonB [Methylocella sp.]|uniref:energy transducer TonB n=1 Tax=Methylocella sp. TaxID=1978226 RepID=UPI0035B03338
MTTGPRQAQRRRAILALKRAKAQAHARMLAAHSQIGAPAVHAGVRDGAGEAQHMSNAAYAALVSAEINRRKHYPERAREARREGAARVVFTIGSSGAIIARSIVRSSGDGDLDAAVLQMMSAAHPPPPPGGGFRGSITISFSLAR